VDLYLYFCINQQLLFLPYNNFLIIFDASPIIHYCKILLKKVKMEEIQVAIKQLLFLSYNNFLIIFDASPVIHYCKILLKK